MLREGPTLPIRTRIKKTAQLLNQLRAGFEREKQPFIKKTVFQSRSGYVI